MKKFINVLAVMLALVMCLGVVVACATDDQEGSGDTTPATTTKGPATTTKPDNTQNTTTAEVTTTAEPVDNRVFEPKVDVPADGVITNADQLHAGAGVQGFSGDGGLVQKNYGGVADALYNQIIRSPVIHGDVTEPVQTFPAEITGVQGLAVKNNDFHKVPPFPLQKGDRFVRIRKKLRSILWN